MEHDAMCHYASFPYLQCGDVASTHVSVWVMQETDRIIEEFDLCTDHARVMAHNAVTNDYFFTTAPFEPIEIEWDCDDCED